MGKGLLLPARDQAWLVFYQGSVAHEVAGAQARAGVHPSIAANHGARVAEWRTCYIVAVAPVMILMLFGFAQPPSYFMAYPIALEAIGLLLGYRLREWTVTRADRRLVYRVPTWFLATVGGLLVSLIPIVLVIHIFTALKATSTTTVSP
jgi:hypothetical protein